MYSKKRLMMLAMFWIIGAAIVFAVYPQFGTSADERGCSSGPCALPAENNIGGIILGTDLLQGQNLVSFGYDNVGAYEEETPPGRVEPTEKHIGLGVSDITTGNFIIYKQWYYYDRRINSYSQVYIWANATSAELASEVSTDTDCGNGNGGWDGAFSCDLVANLSEAAANYIKAETDCSSLGCFAVPSQLTTRDFWVVNPEYDTCGALDALSDVCLAAVSDGGTCVAGTCVTAASVRGEDFYIRGHEYKAVQGPKGNSKILRLNNLYAEIRYGKGVDRLYTPDSSQASNAWGQPLTTQYGEAGLSASFTCQGGGPNTTCDIKTGRVGNRFAESYDNIHQP